jgi:hypothetical protein
MLLLELAGGILAGVLLIQLDRIVSHMRHAMPVVQPGTAQELFVMPRLYHWVALWFGLVALLVAGGTLFLAVEVFKETAELSTARALELGVLGLAVSGLPGFLSYQIFKAGSYRVRVDGRGVLEFRQGHPRFLAWADLRQVELQARSRKLVLRGKDEAVDLEFQVAGFHRLLELLMQHLPPAAPPALPVQFGRPDFKRRILWTRGAVAALVLGAGMALEARHPWPVVWSVAAVALFIGDGQGKGSPKWIRHVKVEATAVTLGTLSKTTVLKMDELESAAIEDYQFRTEVRLGTHLRTKDGRSFRVDAACADPFLLAPALQDAIRAPALF